MKWRDVLSVLIDAAGLAIAGIVTLTLGLIVVERLGLL